MQSDVVWRPDETDLARAQVARFLRWLEQDRAVRFHDYLDAWRWSTRELSDFWDALWRYQDIPGERGDGPALAEERMPGAVWFPGAQVNYAEALLQRAGDGPALIYVPEDAPPREVTWSELRAQAGALARTLRALGVAPGDRVVAYAGNVPETVVGLIAVASLGAIWSVCSPDFGSDGVVARFAQLRPKVLLATTGYRFNGNHVDRRGEAAQIAERLPGLEHTIWIGDGAPCGPGTLSWDAAISEPAPLTFTRVAFDHPLWVLYSSGTTGVPKGIVQGHGGIVLEHLKVLRLGFDLGDGDRLLLLASTSWMVWNTLVSGLLLGVPVVLLDGNPVGKDSHRVWRVIDEVGVTVLGVGASFLHGSMKAGVSPREVADVSSLRELMSTGSPLAPEAYWWIKEAIGPRVWVNSASGGTDVCSALVGGCPTLPVRAGRLQAPALGVAVAAWNEAGEPVVGETGELVVTRPMPSMPLFLWNDPDGERHRATYFEPWPGVWRHGDFITFEHDGSSVIHGRSDATLNRNGIRMGSAELYAIVEGLPEVAEAMVVGVERNGGQGYFMPLFVAVADGATPDRVRDAVVAAVRANLSPRHIPDEVVVVPGIPHTRTGKKLEVPIKRLLQGAPLKDVLDLQSVDDPSLLSFYAAFAAERAGVS